ncbi:MAG: hypothetical protein ACREV8_11095 [Gammaproteobacteria bacterium]
MAVFQGAMFLLLGVGLLLTNYRSLTTGWLPCGPNGFKGRLEFKRSEQPIGFWLMFALYGAGGAWLLVFGLRLLAGQVEPLPLNS